MAHITRGGGLFMGSSKHDLDPSLSESPPPIPEALAEALDGFLNDGYPHLEPVFEQIGALKLPLEVELIALGMVARYLFTLHAARVIHGRDLMTAHAVATTAVMSDPAVEDFIQSQLSGMVDAKVGGLVG